MMLEQYWYLIKLKNNGTITRLWKKIYQSTIFQEGINEYFHLYE